MPFLADSSQGWQVAVYSASPARPVAQLAQFPVLKATGQKRIMVGVKKETLI